MKIVVDARFLRTTTGRYIDRLLHYLQEVDKTNDYTVLLKPQDMDGWQPTNQKFSKLACPYKEFTFAEQLQLLWQIRSLKADLVHFTMVQQPVFYGGRAVTTMHDLTTLRFRNPSKNWLVFSLKQLVYRWVNKRVAQKSKSIITPSQFVKNDIASFAGIPKNKIVVTYEATEKILAKPEPISGLGKNQFIMYVGRPQPHKNLRRLMGAFEVLKTSHPDLKLVLVGKVDPLYRMHQRWAQRRGLKDVVFTGFVTDGQLRWLYENTAAYVFPSLSEGFGLPALEAMAHGAPVASSNATCLPEIYGEAANYFDPLEITDIKNKIEQILDNEKLRKALIQKGFSQVQKYSWRKMAEETLEVYRRAAR